MIFVLATQFHVYQPWVNACLALWLFNILALMSKEYKPSEKCYISDLLQIIKTMAAAPCGTERDIIQQENELYKTISVSYMVSTVVVCCQ